MEGRELLHTTFTYTNTYFLKIPPSALDTFELEFDVQSLLHYFLFKVKPYSERP